MKKNILITGATSGIGLCLIEQMYSKECKIYSVSRNEEKIKTAEKQFPEVTFFRGSVTDVCFLQDVSKIISRESGCLDVLVNGAGIIRSRGFENLDYSEWQEIIDINLTGVFNVSKTMLPLMKKSKGASIVNISSISSNVGGSCAGYCAAKSGVDRLTQFMARELGKYSIRVNSVNPGLIDSGFQVRNNTISRENFDSHLEKMQELYPLGTGSAKDVASLIKFLISDEAKWISGSNYIIDGARSTKN